MPPKPRILFVEDDRDSRDVTCLFLTSQGFEVICAENATEVLKIATEQKFDAYLLDNWLPEVAGPDLCRQLREFDPVTPVIFYSAAAYATDKQSALEAGALCYLVKPADPEDLVDALKTAIAGGGPH
ncbi:MAG TPA: response regulator [Candidatus Saccharimonadales bacterium]|nr:response regulator [Candidatus Saccharimonadales bacterium]